MDSEKLPWIYAGNALPDLQLSISSEVFAIQQSPCRLRVFTMTLEHKIQRHLSS